MTSKPGSQSYSGKSIADTYLLAMRCPVYRRRDSHSGSRMELENLSGDAKRKGTSGSSARLKVPMRRYRGGPPRSSDEAGVMLVERRGWVIDAEIRSTGNRKSLMSWRKAAAFKRWHEPDDARVSRPESVRGSRCNSSGLLGTASSMDEKDERKRTSDQASKTPLKTSKPESSPCSGKSMADNLLTGHVVSGV